MDTPQEQMINKLRDDIEFLRECIKNLVNSTTGNLISEESREIINHLEEWAYKNDN